MPNRCSIRVVFPIFLAAFLTFGLDGESRAAKEPEALMIFKAQKCNKCHTMDAYKIGKLPKTKEAEDDEEGLEEEGTDEKEVPDLSHLSDKVMKSPDPEDYLKKYLKKNLKRDGKKHKKRFKGSEQEFSTLIRFLLETGGANK
ncbi:MAG: hypothetical protein HZA19_01580 [Nitrospirae bacterium]|nr:hypothetical protein [Nitrospirota bacterium]